MTTIAWDGKTLAADRRAVSSGCRRLASKICRLKDGRLVAGSGDQDAVQRVMRWLEGATEKPTFGENDWPAVLVIMEGEATYYERHLEPLRVYESFCAMGSGRDYALAAMHLGKTSAEAVEVAAHFDVFTGDGVETLEIEPK